jgi:deoxyribonuclease V
MILAVDAYYSKNSARVAGIGFERWSSQNPRHIYYSRVQGVDDYRPGEFYKRELPCILALIDEHGLTPGTIVIDGYVYLDGLSKPGLGKYLFDALNGEITIVGVAKNPFPGISRHCEILRGGSTRPLLVTAVGMELSRAKACVLKMHGKDRIPTLLKKADQESRRSC